MSDNRGVADKVVTVVSSAGPIRAIVLNGNELALLGNSFRGILKNEQWAVAPTMFRLRLTGTGTCVMDSRDGLGNITAGVEQFSANGATDQIEYPFPGENALEIRVTTTGTCQAEVL